MLLNEYVFFKSLISFSISLEIWEVSILMPFFINSVSDPIWRSEITKNFFSSLSLLTYSNNRAAWEFIGLALVRSLTRAYYLFILFLSSFVPHFFT